MGGGGNPASCRRRRRRRSGRGRGQDGQVLPLPPYLLLISVLSLLKKPERVRFMSPVGHFSPRRVASEGGVGPLLVSSGGSCLGRKTPTTDGLRGAKLVWFDRETAKRQLLACRRQRVLLCYGREGVTSAETHLTGRDRQRVKEKKIDLILLKKIHAVNIRRL